MKPTDGQDLGRIVDFVENDPQFANEARAFDLIQEIVGGLKRMRKRKGITQDVVAKALGVSQGRISQIESGLLDHAPNLETIAKFAALCGETVALGFSGDAAGESEQEIRPRMGARANLYKS